jgi:hypothetical protein
MIYGIGDSHIRGLGGILEPYHVDAATAYSLLKEDSWTRARKRALLYLRKIPDEDWVVLSFGEVDCRCHINKFPNPYKAAKETVKRYFKFIDEVKKERLIIFLPVPNLYKRFVGKDYREWEERKWGDYSVVGDYSERIMATAMFHLFAKKEAKKGNIRFVGVFEEVLGKDRFYADWVHLNSEGYEFIKRPIKKICKI